MELINEKLLEMIPAIWIPKGHQLNHSTRLEEGLGLYGDEFGYFMYEYMQKFKVDLGLHL